MRFRPLHVVCRSIDALVDSLSTPPEADTPLRYEDMHVAAAPRQLRFLLGRNLKQYRRAIHYNGTRMAISLLIGICFGTLYQNQVRASGQPPHLPICHSSDAGWPLPWFWPGVAGKPCAHCIRHLRRRARPGHVAGSLTARG